MNQELIKDLQTAKRQTWEERERLSEHYDEERRITLANKVTFEFNHYCWITHIQSFEWWLGCSLEVCLSLTRLSWLFVSPRFTMSGFWDIFLQSQPASQFGEGYKTRWTISCWNVRARFNLRHWSFTWNDMVWQDFEVKFVDFVVRVFWTGSWTARKEITKKYKKNWWPYRKRKIRWEKRQLHVYSSCMCTNWWR